MAHELKKYDDLVLYKNSAWHGLGQVMDKEISLDEAVTVAGLGKDVIQEPCFATVEVDGQPVTVDVEKKVNLWPNDDGTFSKLGVVSNDWTIVQVRDMVEDIKAIVQAGDGEIVVESAGSIRNHKKLWFLLDAGKFELPGGDEVRKYLAVANGFDAQTAYSFIPTSTRVVCANTLNAVLDGQVNGIRFSHSENIRDRVDQAKAALFQTNKMHGEFETAARQLANVPISSADAKEFFSKCYTLHNEGGIPLDPKTKKEKRAQEKAAEAFGIFGQILDDEAGKFGGANRWVMLNAYTGLIQHYSRSYDTSKATGHERRVESVLFGSGARKSSQAFSQALSL